jgi:type II secretory pathway pseudopilin PulG
MAATASHSPSGRALPRHAAGFTYISLIILLAVIGLATAATLRLGVTLQRVAAEQALLDIGEEFSNALRSYAAATPQGQPQQPPTLQQLLKDPRFPGTRRHLRKIFVDPMTGKAEWGVVYLGEKVGVVGVYSLSTARAIKLANFPQRFQAFNGREYIADWKFTRDGQDPPLPKPAGGLPPLIPPPPGHPPPAAPVPAPVPVPPRPVQPAPEMPPVNDPEPVSAPEPAENVESET